MYLPELLASRTTERCARLLPRIDGGYLDCVSDDLALLLAMHGVSDVRTPFAQDWRFDLSERAGLPVRVDLPPADQDELLARRTGWRPQWRPVTSVADDLLQWRHALGAGDPVLLVADAFCLPWLPYAGHEHMDHGFVLAGLSPGDGAGCPADELTAHIVDPYQNVTEWGVARPVITQLPLTELDSALAGGCWAVLVPATAEPPVNPACQLAANATAILAAADHGSYQRFIAGHQEAGADQLQNLTLQTWLLARNRALHASWLAGLDPSLLDQSIAERFLAQVSGGWQRAMEMSYIALRRVRSGRRAPGAAIAAVEAVSRAETDLARSLLSRRD
jgi:hypothetical protein